MFTVDYLNQDGSEGIKDYDDLDSAQYEAATLSENGCHCIMIIDPNGVDCSF
jgi:hypothetical protein